MRLGWGLAGEALASGTGGLSVEPTDCIAPLGLGFVGGLGPTAEAVGFHVAAPLGPPVGCFKQLI
jgi:hypothetical protein